MIKISNYGEVENSEIFARQNTEENVSKAVSEIIAEVVKNGDKALVSYAEKFDGAKLAALEVTDAEIKEAFGAVEPAFIAVLEEAAANIKHFHEKQVRSSFVINDKDGVVMGQKVMPIEKVGIYVPGGTAAYPSTVLMDSIPAKIAGCAEIINPCEIINFICIAGSNLSGIICRTGIHYNNLPGISAQCLETVLNIFLFILCNDAY